MDIKAVIVHNLDADKCQLQKSDTPVDLFKSNNISILIEKLVKAMQKSNTISKAKIRTDISNSLLDNDTFNFLIESHSFASEWSNAILMDDNPTSSNMIFAHIEQGESILWAFFEMKNRGAYIKLDEEFVHNDSTLGMTLGAARSAFIYDLSNKMLLMKVESELLPIIEDIFNCDSEANSVQIFKTVESLVKELAVARNEQPSLMIMQLKQVVSDNMIILESINPWDLINYIFTDLTDEENELVKVRLSDINLVDDIVLKEIKRTNLVKKYTIETESGIEIVVPIRGVNLASILKFIDSEEGQVELQLKNIGKLL